ncbi:MAG: hypothetical protein IKL48_03455 [Elusimicrobiaceae bacterium]|nr:hypothetical protein [Elusimicrobiaceae bacterium]
MKRNVLLLLSLFCASCVSVFTQTFTPDTSLVIDPTPQEASAFYDKTRPPFLAVYQKGKKTLVLLAASHGPQSLPAVQYAFEEYTPNVALIEREPGFHFGNCNEHEDAYTAALSGKNNIPLVRTDADLETQWKYAKKHGFSYDDFQMFWIIRNAYGFAKYEGKQTNAAQEIRDYKRTVHNPVWGELFTEERLLAYFNKHYHKDFNTTDFISFYMDLMEVSPKEWVRETPFYKIMHGQPDVRSVFMLENIAAALNEYQVVFSEMGAVHFIDIHKALEKMLGKPHYITADQLPTQQIWKDCTLDGLQEKVLVP